MKNLKTGDWLLIAGEAGLFFIVTIVVWLDEFMDLPARFLGATPKPFRPQEYLVEAVSILIVAVVAITITFISLRISRLLQKTITTRELEINRLRAFAKNTSITLQGRGLSPGMVEGVALVYQSPESELISGGQAIARNDVKPEIDRLDGVLAAAIYELDNTQKQYAGDMAAAESSLLDAHLAMLKDVEFWDKCRQRAADPPTAGSRPSHPASRSRSAAGLRPRRRRPTRGLAVRVRRRPRAVTRSGACPAR